MDSLNILTIPTHSGYEYNLAKTGHQFWALSGIPGCKQTWDAHNRPQPENYHVVKALPEWLKIDVVLSQHKFGQIQYLGQIAKNLALPLVNIEHTLPMPDWSEEKLKYLATLNGDINCFISQYSMGKWGYQEDNTTRIVHHGIDTNDFKPVDGPRENRILSVVNDWINRDYCCGYSIWERVTKDLNVFPVGDTQGLSKPAASLAELAKFYRESRIFINTSTVSPIPTSLLEAMASGCACVSTDNCMIPEIIQDGFNGFITNDEALMTKRLQQLTADEKLANELGANARATIEQMFSLNKFIATWNDVFTQAVYYF